MLLPITIFLLLFFCGNIFSEIVVNNGGPLVTLKNGELRGKMGVSRGGRNYASFLGIRYAHTPLRFQPPESLASETWTNVKEATEFGPRCPQHGFLTEEYMGEEDCLYLNVYVPGVIGDNYPVMVWIHGGGYIDGEGDSYGPKYFMDQNVILVTLNYRLGALGFLSTGDGVVAGNAGMKDQVLALKWVQSNIEAFGGNPHSVTIFGESAGASSVHLLLVSPMTLGLDLFHRAIIQSGSASCPWALKTKDTSLRDANRLGEFLNCPKTTTSSSRELLECLNKQKVQDIIGAQKKFIRWNRDPVVVFAPTMDEMSVPRKSNFLPLSPNTLIQQNNYNRVPVMIGLTGDEGLLIHSVGVLGDKQLTQELNQNWNRIAPLTFFYEDLFPKDELDIVSQKIKQFYFQEKSVSGETFQNLTNLYSDAYFVYGIVKDALSLAEKVDVYLYVMTYMGEFSLMSYLGPKEIFGVGHADDLQYLFNTNEYSPQVEPEVNSQSGQFSTNLVKLWVSFAKNGKPESNISWKPISENERIGTTPLKLFQLNSERTVVDNPFEDRLKFWTTIFEEHGVRMGKAHPEPFPSRDEL